MASNPQSRPENSSAKSPCTQGGSARAAQSARDTRDTYEPQPRRLLRGDDPPPAPYEPELDLDDFGAHDDDARHPQSLEQSFELDEERPFPSQPPRGRSPRAPESEDEYEHAPPPRSYVGIIKLVVMACIIGIVAAFLVPATATILSSSR